MFNPELSAAVERFATLFVDLPDSSLDLAWRWKGYDEGLRFSFFVTSLELRQLAVKLAASQPAPSSAQRILAQYHAAYLDLQAAVFGLSEETANLAPAEGEWPVSKIYAHILGAEFGFTAVLRYALVKHRAGSWMPDPMPEAEYPRWYAISEEDYDKLMNGPFQGMLAYHRELHPTILREFATISEDELGKPAAFWEESRFHIAFRLHRYEAHFRQHTIQIDKTHIATGNAPSEARRLIRMLYGALADVNGCLIGVDGRKSAESIDLSRTIDARTKELAKLLK